MKKLLTLLLVALMTISMVACGEETTNKDTTTMSEENALLSVGDTAQGSSCNVTVTSVEYVDKIENGYLNHMWSPATKDTYQDVTAEEGYSIIKISYHFEYTGKEAGVIPLRFILNYDDGYTFEAGYDFKEGWYSNGNGGHALPSIESKSRVGYEEKYVFDSQTRFEISDPLEFQATDACVYIFVNDAVKTNTDKSCVLEVTIPSSTFDDARTVGLDYSVSYPEIPEIETFVYNLR